MEQKNTFNENLENNYNFSMTEGKIYSGTSGSIICGTMSDKNVGGGYEVKIPIALKTFKVGCETDFKKEKNFFKYLSKHPEIDSKNIVKCYGIANIDGNEYVVMEDLNKENFITFYSLWWKVVNLIIKESELEAENTKSDNIKENLLRTEDYNEIIKIAPITKSRIDELRQWLIENKIRHNDLGWKNLMINLDNGNIKVIDFGLSSVNDEEVLEFSTDLERMDKINEEIDKIVDNPEKMLVLDNK